MREHQKTNGGKRNIPVPPGKEINRDSPSSGERTGKSPNFTGVKPAGVAREVLWDLAGRGGGLVEELQS